MPSILFYIFAILMITGGICVVALKNPVSSAMGMIGSFIALAALFIGLNAYFIGTLMILVYAGAIMVLFIFIIMLLDLKKESKKEFHVINVAAGVIIPLLLVMIICPVFISVDKDFEILDKKALTAAEASLPESEVPKDSLIRPKLREGEIPDVNLIGQKTFTVYNFPLQVVGVLLLVATIGCVTLSKKLHGDEAPADADDDGRMAKTIAKSKDIPKVATLNGPDTEHSENTEVGNAADSVEEIEEPTEESPTTEEEVVKPESVAESSKGKKAKQSELTLESDKKSKTVSAKSTTSADDTDLPEHATTDEKLGLIYTERPDDADDLTEIKGVGPVIVGKLNGFGVYTFKQISQWSPEVVSEFDGLLSFKGRIDRDDWLTQATELHANK